jgi:poly-gamma-glutamate synthesis protein (capsule biosynthesis protein)
MSSFPAKDTAAKQGYSLLAAGQSLIRRTISDDSSDGYRNLVQLIRKADIAFTNLEGTIRGRFGGWPIKNKTVHASDVSVLHCLRLIGFNVLSLANNHAADLGPGGILSTIEATKSLGFLAGGTGPDRSSARRPKIMTIAGRRVALLAMDSGPWPEYVYALGDNPESTENARPGVNKLGLHRSLGLPAADIQRLREILTMTGQAQRLSQRVSVGFQPSPPEGLFDFFGMMLEEADQPIERLQPDPDDVAAQLESVRQAREQADVVIVYLHNHHWAPDWSMPPDWAVKLARSFVDAGADLFVGHGVPVLQGMEIYRGKPMFFGLGNFIFHSARRSNYQVREMWESLVANCNFAADGTLEFIELWPIMLGGEAAQADLSIDRLAPHLAVGADAERIIDRFTAASRLEGWRLHRRGDTAVIEPAV